MKMISKQTPLYAFNSNQNRGIVQQKIQNKCISNEKKSLQCKFDDDGYRVVIVPLGRKKLSQTEGFHRSNEKC